MSESRNVLEVQDLKTYFYTRNGVVRAVDGVSFSLGRGETLGIVGESGSGKSVTCHALLGLVPQPPGRIEGGTARLAGVDLLAAKASVLRRIRGKRIAMIFQDPMTSLNPYLRMSTQLIEPLQLHESMKKKPAVARAVEALREVGIQDPDRRIHDYPHEFSGGMRQRVMIAMAMMTHPEILIADEPTTALDVTVQAQILELIKCLQTERGMAVILITHDLGVVAGVCDRVAVMYAGKILESGSTEDIFYDPKHPYTQALQRSIPRLRERLDILPVIPGHPPDHTHPIRGCAFAPRCEYARESCAAPVALMPVGENHAAACIRVQKGEL